MTVVDRIIRDGLNKYTSDLNPPCPFIYLMRDFYWMCWDLHVVPVSDGADTEEEEGRAHQLVSQSPHQSQMVGREGTEDGRGVRGDSVAAPVVFIPDQRVPVDQEYCAAGQECSEVLGSDVVRHLEEHKYDVCCS